MLDQTSSLRECFLTNFAAKFFKFHMNVYEVPPQAVHGAGLLVAMAVGAFKNLSLWNFEQLTRFFIFFLVIKHHLKFSLH